MAMLGEPQEPSEGISTSSSSATRRTFMRRLGGTLAVAVPAIRVLASSRSAVASVTPDIDPCADTYNKYEGHYCTVGGGNTCPAGTAGDCIGEYTIYSRITGQVCGQFTDDEGRCGVLACGPTGSAAPAAC